jgi:hypothetical protein
MMPEGKFGLWSGRVTGRCCLEKCRDGSPKRILMVDWQPNQSGIDDSGIPLKTLAEPFRPEYRCSEPDQSIIIATSMS